MSASQQAQKPQNDQNTSVMVALDGSPAARTALPLARAIARQLQARLTILHVAPTKLPYEVLRRRLDLGPEDLEEVDLHIHRGDAAAGILRMMEEPGRLLTVMTTHGRNIEQGRTLGHIAEAVVATTRRPVLLVRPEAANLASSPSALVRCMLFPLDGSPTTTNGLVPAKHLASALRASVDVLYVANPEQRRPEESGSVSMPSYVDQPQHEWPEWASEVMERLAACANCPHNVPVRVYLAYGAIEDEIIRFAVAHHEDMIVLVRRSHMEPGRAHVLRAVLHRSPCPVLLTSASGGDVANSDCAGDCIFVTSRRRARHRPRREPSPQLTTPPDRR